MSNLRLGEMTKQPRHFFSKRGLSIKIHRQLQGSSRDEGFRCMHNGSIIESICRSLLRYMHMTQGNIASRFSLNFYHTEPFSSFILFPQCDVQLDFFFFFFFSPHGFLSHSTSESSPFVIFHCNRNIW